MTRLAIDIGSEFVDLAVAAPAGCSVHKVAAGDLDSADAILRAVDKGLNAISTPITSLSEIRIGSTAAVNTVLRRDGGPIALLTTKGFGDCLWLGRQNRADLYNPVAGTDAPTFLLDRGNVFEIAGRVDADGRETAPLDEAAVLEAAAAIGERGLQPVAICLLFAHVNPAHEHRCAALLKEALPGIDISLSHEIDPQPREYERTVSTCLEAWLRRRMRPLISALLDGFAQRGFTGLLYHSDGRGALRQPEEVVSHVSSLMASGPAAAAQTAGTLAGAHGLQTAIGLDIGSTSADFTILENSRLHMSHGSTFAGVPLRQMMVDVESVAIGGSSRVVAGPGDRFTLEPITPGTEDDASLSDALEQAKLISREKGAKNVEDATAIIGDAEQAIAAAILTFCVKRNVDPTNAALIAMGGLGGVLGAGIAERLGIRRLIVPPAPAAAGALGLLMTAPGVEAAEAVNADTSTMTDADLETLMMRLERRVAEQAEQRGVEEPAPMRIGVQMAATAHMHPQYFELDAMPASVEALAGAFSDHQFAHLGVRPRTGGFVFSIALSKRGTPDTYVQRGLALSDAPQSPASAPLVFQTVAGTVHKPAGWSLRSENNAYVLTWEPGP